MNQRRTLVEARADGDRIACATIDAHVPTPRPAGYCSSRPSNFAEMQVQAEENGFEHAWSNFLHEFFFWRTAEFFALPPPSSFGRQTCALLAGSAEFLCHRYALDVQAWASEPRYTLKTQWDPGRISSRI